MFKCYFRIKSKKPGQIDGGKEDIAHFFLGTALVGSVKCCSKFSHFLTHLLKNSFCFVPIETHLRSFTRKLISLK